MFLWPTYRDLLWKLKREVDLKAVTLQLVIQTCRSLRQGLLKKSKECYHILASHQLVLNSQAITSHLLEFSFVLVKKHSWLLFYSHIFNFSILDPHCNVLYLNHFTAQTVNFHKASEFHLNEYSKGNTREFTCDKKQTTFVFILSHGKARIVTISLSYQNKSILNLCKKNAIAQAQQPG